MKRNGLWWFAKLKMWTVAGEDPLNDTCRNALERSPSFIAMPQRAAPQQMEHCENLSLLDGVKNPAESHHKFGELQGVQEVLSIRVTDQAK
jgi:hypothetical protein